MWRAGEVGAWKGINVNNSLNTKLKSYLSTLRLAFIYGHVNVLQSLLDHGKNGDFSSGSNTTKRREWEDLELLLLGTPLFIQIRKLPKLTIYAWGWSFLDYLDINALAFCRDQEVVQVLLGHGSDLNANLSGVSLLQKVAWKGQSCVLEFLLKRVAGLNSFSDDGKTMISGNIFGGGHSWRSITYCTNS